MRSLKQRLDALEAARGGGDLFVAWVHAEPPRYTIDGEVVTGAEFTARLPQAGTVIRVEYTDGAEWREQDTNQL